MTINTNMEMNSMRATRTDVPSGSHELWHRSTTLFLDALMGRVLLALIPPTIN